MDSMFKINFKSSFFLVQAAIPHMRNRPGANIIFISSFVAYNPIILPIYFYAIMKAAII